jgi:hypothetical protein
MMKRGEIYTALNCPESFPKGTHFVECQFINCSINVNSGAFSRCGFSDGTTINGTSMTDGVLSGRSSIYRGCDFEGCSRLSGHVVGEAVGGAK